MIDPMLGAETPMREKKEWADVFIAVAYALFSLIYFGLFDRRFYLVNMLNCGVSLVVPIPYIMMSAVVLFCHCRFTHKGLKEVFYPVAAMAIILPLVYFIADMKIKCIVMDPFSWNRGIYKIYAEIYSFSVLAIFSVLSGLVSQGLSKGLRERGIIAIPFLIYFAFIETLLLANGIAIWALWLLLLFLLFVRDEASAHLIDTVSDVFRRLFEHRSVYLPLIFIAAFAIRYAWGARLIETLGGNYLLASDDGRPYDNFAAMIAAGQHIPKEDVFCLNGFGYWHFLAAIYRIFGPHNFRMVVVFQSFLGASVPIFTYFICKRIFDIRLAAVAAAAIASLNPTLIFISVVVGMEALYVPLFSLAVMAAVYLLANGDLGRGKAFLVGSLLGLANNVRGELLFAPLILAGLLCIFKKNLGMKAAALKTIFVFSGFLLCASLQHAVSYSMYGEYHITQTAIAGNFAAARFGDENLRLDKMGFNPFRSLGSSMRTLLDEPAAVTSLLLTGFSKRLAILYLQPNFGVFDPIFLVNPSSGYLFTFPLYLQFYGYIFTIMGVLEAFARKENIFPKAILLTFVFYISSIYAFILIQNPRNRAALIPISLTFFSYGLALFIRRVRDSFGWVMAGRGGRLS